MQRVRIAPFDSIGISIRTTNEKGQANKEIVALWGRFMAEGILNTIPNKVDHTIYGIYTDYESDHTQPYTVILGCKVNALDVIPKGMIGRSIEGGTYCKTKAYGDLTKGLMVNHWSEIWKMDLDRRYTADFEVYGEKAIEPTAAEIDIFVSVK
ncbi:effector binding domain-containing protein [Maribacter sp. ANRC-HE7]|uniref:Effector binding domain-containing protein n=1 Tax=Maribacter aquimaris TaxID=2737171 RepID=A0ABR7UYQ5_9FLAO|nr:GyrI-like domain-containing protein [Maribacter aquimaris]MBD0777401.1 effector binding domain-containing protein [Maribacter aquimaris]